MTNPPRNQPALPVNNATALPADGQPLPNITWRSLTLDDAPALLELVNASEEADRFPMRTSLDELSTILSDPATTLERDSLGGFIDGRPVCYGGAQLRIRLEDRRAAVLFGGVRPDLRRRGLGRLVLAWSEARGWQLLESEPEGIPRFLEAWSDERLADRTALLSSAGFEPIRYYDEMIRPLSAAIPDPALPNGLRFEQWREELDEQFREAHNEAFADHWGSTPLTAETWQHRFVGWPSFRPDLTYAVMDGDQLAAYCITYHSPQDVLASGRREGWLGQIGTRRAWRKRGLASSLISHVMRRLQQVGLDHAALAVDSANPTGAAGLYARLGFRTEHREIRWAKAASDTPPSR